MLDNSLTLDHIRGVLIRLEETIIFGCIERSQFKRNAPIYIPGGVGTELGRESLLGFMLREAEQSHAKVRRYTSPDEHPFYDNLPGPILPELSFADCPLHPNAVNINSRIRDVYEKEIIPFICSDGDDQQYGSSAVSDVGLLQTLSKRIHYGKFVAESKYQRDQGAFDAMIAAGDAQGLHDAITVPHVEAELFQRVERKTNTYVRELVAAGESTIAPGAVRTIYERWIVPLSKVVEVEYLLSRT